MDPWKRLPRLIVSALLLGAPGFAEPDTGPARLVEDLAPGTLPADLRISGFLPVGNRSVFVRDDHESRVSLWIADGTAAGTSPLAVLCPPCQAARAVGSTGSLAFYRVHSFSDTAIWRTDGTPAGTFPVTSGLSRPYDERGLESLSGGRLFFTACSPELGCELWSTDGSAAGTAPAGEVVPGPGSAVLRELAAAAGGRAFLIAEVPGEPATLWLAHAQGLERLREVPDAAGLAVHGNRAFFAARKVEVWTSDGTAEGTRPAAAFPPRPDSRVGMLAVLDGRAFFVAEDRQHGSELWSVGPRPDNLRRLTDFPGPSAWIRDVRKSGNRLVFVAATAQFQGRPRLWSSNGNLRSSAPLTGCAGGCPMVVGPLTPVAPGRFVFHGHNREGGGIWVTDGTTAGTRLLQRTVQLGLAQAVPAAGRVLIQITEEYETGELWVTDGTAAGTFFVTAGGPTFSHYYGWSRPLAGGGANSRILFPGLLDGETFEEVLWSSDGSRAGSHPIAEARTPRGSHPGRLTPFRDGLLARTCSGTAVEMRFVQGTASTVLLALEVSSCGAFFTTPIVLGDVAVFQGIEGLWRTDGTPEGTELLFPSTSTGSPLGLVRFGDEAAFSVTVPSGSTYRLEIWRTDGTPEGTRKRLELPAGTDAIGLASAGGRLWFFDWVPLAEDQSALRPWASDGTPAGTHPVTGRYGYTPDDPSSFVEAGGRVFFLFAELGNPLQIWGSDGTPAGTGPAVTRESGAGEPEALAAIGDRLYFTAPRKNDLAGRLLPWVSEGTDAGTGLLADVDAGGDPDFALPDSPPFVELDSRVFFAASDPGHGDQLWSTDGTPAGTERLADVAPGRLGSYPRGLTVWNGRLWFRARDAVHGMELWSSDGTAEGTRLVQDIAPGASWSAPAEMTATEAGLYFSAHDGVHGREIWLLPDL